MFFKQIKKLLSNRKRNKRPFISFQIEPTSKCQLRCTMCPMTTGLPHCEPGDISWETYEKISAYFHLTRNVHLQGWGEPLLNPRLFDMIKIAKAAGCDVSLTTNGFLLNAVTSERMTREGVDIVAISLAGARAGTHESIRKGSNFKKLLDNIKTFTAMKADTKKKTPKLVLSFLMTKTNIHELSDAVELSRSIGADELVATNLDYTPTQQQYCLKAFSLDHADPDFEKIIAQAKKKARELKLPLRTYPLVMDEVLMCELNPLEIVYISHDGAVSPCVYLNPYKHGSLKRIFRGTQNELERLCFGNAGERDFLEIWNSPGYTMFRGQYEIRVHRRKALLSQMPFESGDMKGVNLKMEQLLKQYPVPEVCKSCYKAYGI